MRFLSQLVRPNDGKSWIRAMPVAGQSRRPVRRFLVEALEPRQLLSGLTLTAAGLADGFGLLTFATGFPENSFGLGPISVAFPATGGVLATDTFGNLRLFPTDTDGQDAASITPIQNFGGADAGNPNAFALAQLNGTIYMTQAGTGDVVKLINNGASTQVVVSGISRASAVVADPFNNLLYVHRAGNGAPIYVVDPVAKTVNVFQNIQADGLSLSPDGKTLYAAIDGGASAGHVLGFDTTTKALDFDSGAISGGPDGIAVGKGPVAGNLFVNTNGGTIVEVNLATAAKTLIASGGSRGDLVTVDANNATLLVTQSDRIMRAHPGGVCHPSARHDDHPRRRADDFELRPAGHPDGRRGHRRDRHPDRYRHVHDRRPGTGTRQLDRSGRLGSSDLHDFDADAGHLHHHRRLQRRFHLRFQRLRPGEPTDGQPGGTDDHRDQQHQGLRRDDEQRQRSRRSPRAAWRPVIRPTSPRPTATRTWAPG